MTAGATGTPTAGSLGPVALSGGLALLALSPLMRGGNRPAALIVLELLALFVLLAAGLRCGQCRGLCTPKGLALLLLASSPAWLAMVQLTPLPPGVWLKLSGREPYQQALQAAGGSLTTWRPISVAAESTAASLLAGIPLIASGLVGYLASLGQLRLILRLVVGLAFAQVLLAVLQMAGGEASPLYFGLQSNRPVGTFANSNHLANYLCMALVALIWLAYESRRTRVRADTSVSRGTPALALAWAGGALLLILGIIMTRSRGAALVGIPTAAAAFAFVFLRLEGAAQARRFVLPVIAVLIAAAVATVGLDTATSRASTGDLAGAAGYRALLAGSSFDGALAYWPLGSGWGTYPLVYPRFQPVEIAGFANHAHMDYVELLFEGGILFVLCALVFAWLATRRVVRLATLERRQHALAPQSMAVVLCGLALLTLLLHSLVEFNMRIPAIAILGALFAGAFLRPLGTPSKQDDRPAQPHPSGN